VIVLTGLVFRFFPTAKPANVLPTFFFAFISWKRQFLDALVDWRTSDGDQTLIGGGFCLP
jgi:hypothetical protein